MIKGCSNHGCVVRGTTGGQHTDGTCRCVGLRKRLAQDLSSYYVVEVCGQQVGPAVEDVLAGRKIEAWLDGGGLRDILTLERHEGQGQVQVEGMA